MLASIDDDMLLAGFDAMTSTTIDLTGKKI